MFFGDFKADFKADFDRRILTDFTNYLRRKLHAALSSGNGQHIIPLQPLNILLIKDQQAAQRLCFLQPDRRQDDLDGVGRHVRIGDAGQKAHIIAIVVQALQTAQKSMLRAVSPVDELII